MVPKPKFILFSEKNSYWYTRLLYILPFTATTLLIEKEEALTLLSITADQFILADSAYIASIHSSVELIYRVLPNTLVIVLGDGDENWQEARDAFRLGVIDYLPQSIGDSELKDLLLKLSAEEPFPLSYRVIR